MATAFLDAAIRWVTSHALTVANQKGDPVPDDHTLCNTEVDLSPVAIHRATARMISLDEAERSFKILLKNEIIEQGDSAIPYHATLKISKVEDYLSKRNHIWQQASN